jgi:hypothetical protein
MAHQKDGRNKPNFTSYKHPAKKSGNAARKAREHRRIEDAKRRKALDNRLK